MHTVLWPTSDKEFGHMKQAACSRLSNLVYLSLAFFLVIGEVMPTQASEVCDLVRGIGKK